MNDPHILLRIVLLAKEPELHLALLSHRPYAKLCANEGVQAQLMAAHTILAQVYEGWVRILPNAKIHSPDKMTPAREGKFLAEWG